MLIYRRFSKADAAACFDVFYNAVRRGTIAHYNEEQRKAWAPSAKMPENWPTRLSNQSCWVAISDSTPVGFMSMEGDGHVDLAFVAPDMTRQGVARSLYKHIEEDAKKLELERLFTEASHLARPFFETQGWEVTLAETITYNGQSIERFQMAKDLG
ncbi:GNAT family N-acetyltransferase [Falsihalocynthiibacter sp. SS001]|uniref:GNAT family N-acetyltransferase n=1 Tax=Falsihalocynthiibacter sp. SS001 TaxID=3349698 RepID=UPI0036D364B6